MAAQFDYFVVFAEMRTGSNFLEANINAFDGLACHGEAFNPHFIGYPNSTDILGIDQAARDASPASLVRAIRDQDGTIGGFRYFHDHDPRVLDMVLDDPRCAKVILTRNPVDSYVSWKIAQSTGQWKLTDVKRRKDGQAVFDGAEFTAHLDALQAFQVRLLNRLQTSGQTAFYIAYEDLQSVEVMNGLARYLGASSQLDELDKSLKKQNPSPISGKVRNYIEMERSLSGLDRFNLTRTPNFEPRRGPTAPSYVAAAKAALMYLPIKGGPEQSVSDWLASLDGVEPTELLTKMSQKDLRQWKRKHKGHRSFTVLRHPVARAHDAFCTRILSNGPDAYGPIRRTLIKRYGLPVPEHGADDSYDRAAHKTAFLAFIAFLKGNLAGQTAIRVDATWCTQAQALQGFGDFALPDRVIREADIASELVDLAAAVGRSDATPPQPAAPDTPFALSEIYDSEIEAKVTDVYQRDYMMFGFTSWR